MKSEKELFIIRVKQEISRNQTILNLGCLEEYKDGESVHKELIKEGYDSRGVDIFEGEGVDIQADLNKDFPIQSESYTQVLAMEIIEHVDNPTHFLSECYRILKPGGKLILTTPNACNIIHFMEANKALYDDKDTYPHLHYFDKHAGVRVLKKAGFRHMRVELHAAHYNRNLFMRLVQHMIKPWRSNLLFTAIK